MSSLSPQLRHAACSLRRPNVFAAAAAEIRVHDVFELYLGYSNVNITHKFCFFSMSAVSLQDPAT